MQNAGKQAFVTMITPYKEDGSVDLETVKRYVRFYFDAGLDGIFAVCQSSEIFYLSVEERAAIARTVWETVGDLERESGRRMTVVSSGHVADGIDAQASELNAVASCGTDALILITNRLAAENEGDDVWIENAEKLLKKLPSDLPLGLYECPHPYKRLVSKKTLKWAASTGRFRFMKDTCCDAELIQKRVALLEGSGLALLNANCQTLLETLRGGADGYCGIMANFHPKLYKWLCAHPDDGRADLVQSVTGTFGFTEGGLPYPLTAKYHMTLEGIPTVERARNRPGEVLSAYAKDCVKQMRSATKAMEAALGI